MVLRAFLAALAYFICYGGNWLFAQSMTERPIVDELAVENYGVAFRQGSDVRDAVNEIFADMVADGSLGALADKYGLELAD